jgi:hypothetical protein
MREMVCVGIFAGSSGRKRWLKGVGPVQGGTPDQGRGEGWGCASRPLIGEAVCMGGRDLARSGSVAEAARGGVVEPDSWAL